MPYKFESIPVGRENDRRIKLTDEQRDEIRHKYSTGQYSQRQLASEYNVSRRLIVFILYPERQRKVDSAKYYSTEKQRVYMQRHRDHKKKLYEEGKIK